ncbi:MAG: glycosyltransferase family 2 protein, partial [Burkholderiales bacterium]|nr:glycosyltransferase family 2 protein [Opitutaceae bacterium]
MPPSAPASATGSAYRPTISVVIPAFNAAPWLPVALDSISAQSYPNLEIIVIDDGSTDETPRLLRRHAACDSRLRVISRPNTGIVGALNDGLAAARGHFIARMDADDAAAPDRLALQLERFVADPGLVALGSAVTFMDDAGHSVQSCPRPLHHADIERALLAGDGGAMIHPSVMFRATTLWIAGGYRPAAQYLEDLDLFLRLARLGTLANLPQPLLRYRVHPASINFTKQAGRHALKLVLLREAHEHRSLPFDPSRIPESTTHGDPACHAREWAATSLAFGSRRVAVAHGYRAVRLQPRAPASWRALRYA